MKQKLQKIAFYYFVAASVSAYLITVISLIANQNWHEYFVSPVYLYCQLLPAGSILGMPTEIILSILPLLFVCVSFILYLTQKAYYSVFALPVLLGNIVLLAIVIIILLLLGTSGSTNISGKEIAFLLSSILDIALWIVLFGRKRS
ncbi:MAG: hypothetical protein IJW00_09125 [Clostridia bacterium]|nr:hypothetical protein [Clostridia bacterium]